MSAGGAAGPIRGRRELLGAVVSAGLVAVAVLLAFLGGGEDEDPSSQPPRIVDAAEMVEVEAELDHPIYWAGPLPGSRLELSVEPDGSVYLRYLPPGAAVGGERAAFLTIGTYPVAGAQAAIMRTARAAGVRVRHTADGGIVLANPSSPGSVYLVYPGSDLQIEVYDPEPGRAMELIETAAIRPVG